MLLFRGVLGVVLFAVWVFALIDVITADESRIRHLPKIWWIVIVFLFFDVGAIVWFVAGRPVRGRATNLPYKGNRGAVRDFPEYERPGRATAQGQADDGEFLRRCRERAEEQRRRHREQAESDDAEEA